MIKREYIYGMIFFVFTKFSIAWAENENDKRENRLKELYVQVRCPVCRGQSIEDSNAPLALELKQQIGKWLDEGHTDKQISTELERQYGMAILMKPPFVPATYLLWLAPFLLFMFMIIILRRIFSSKSK